MFTEGSITKQLTSIFLAIMAFFFGLIVLPIVVVGARVRVANEHEMQTATAVQSTEYAYATETATLWTPTYTPTFTPSNTPTFTLTFTPTNTATQTPTATFTPTYTPTFTPTFTPTPTNTSTFTPTPTFTLTYTPTPYIVGDYVITPAAPQTKMYVIHDANIRTCPQRIFSCDIIGAVEFRDELDIIGSVEGDRFVGSSMWYYFKLDGEDAFIHSSLVVEELPD